MHEVEPHYGWLKYYTNHQDPNSPFHAVEHNQLYYDRQVYQYLAHPQWDDIGSDGLLVKILAADYEQQFAFIELFGVWHDLLDNDFRLLLENCLEPLLHAGIDQFILVADSLLNIYLDSDDYYDAYQEHLEDGWNCLLRARPHIRQELTDHQLDHHFFWSDELDALPWRTLPPKRLFQTIQQRIRRLLPE